MSNKNRNKLQAIRNRKWYKKWSKLIEISDKSDITTLLEKVFHLLDDHRIFMYHRSMLWSLESLHQALKDHDKDNEVEVISKTISECGYKYTKQAKILKKRKLELMRIERRMLYGNDIPF